ncbi:MAG: ParB N-terminal domain-containing protein [Acidiferrobacterales bacterium]|nr:ParB N-terminal domain-containing protein [Acidiferrobacterales bacterium]
MSNRPSSEQIAQRLRPQKVSDFEQETNFVASLVTKTFLTIPISDLETYDKNPRRMRNPNFKRIKDSISRDGINQPLAVTQRPGSKKFTIYKGGNTRLKAVQELYSETGDRKYRFVDCLFHPWTGFESDAIVGHLQENQMRKSLCFIDRAFGTKLAIEHLKQEADSSDLSLRDIREMLARKGYNTTISSISIMLYASDSLEPLLPREICVAMGRPQVQKLRSLEKAFHNVCSEFEISKRIAASTFRNTLKNYEGLEWSHSSFRRSLESALSAAQSLSIQDIALRIDGYLHVTESPLRHSPEAINTEFAKFDQIEWINERTKIEQNPTVRSVNTPNNEELAHNTSATVAVVDADQDDATDVSDGIPPIFSFSSPSGQQKSELELEVERMRRLCYQIALKLAKRYDFHENKVTKNTIVSNIGNWGIGFLITDYPAAASDSNLSQIGTRDALWWFLVEFCDLQWATERARPLVAKLVGNSKFLNFVKSGNSRTLSLHAKGVMKLTYPHLSLLTFCLRQLDEASWNELNHLNTLYRSLHHLSRKNGVQLFRPPKQGEIRNDYKKRN